MLHDFFDAAAFAAAEERLAAAAADPLLATRVFDCSVRGATGAIAVRVHVKPLPASAGLAGATFTFVDKRDAGQARAALSSALLQNQAILDNAVLGIAVVENGRTLQANARMNTLFGYVEPGDGSVHNVAVRSLYADDATWLAARAATAADFGACRVHKAEYQLARADGTRFWGRLSGRPFDPGQPRARSVWLVDDVTERVEAADAVRRQAEARVHHMAYYDGLTGLPNRALLAERLERALATAQRSGRKVALMFLDLEPGCGAPLRAR
jgi:PAS domain S-box-containing protein